jgi:transcriptional regulator with XRE-family HTH domain
MAKKARNPVDKHVGSRVRMRRMMLGMSQGKLGDALGLTFQQVQKYEKGTNRIGASRLQHISHILQVPVAFFFEGAPHQPAAQGDRRGTLAGLCVRLPRHVRWARADQGVYAHQGAQAPASHCQPRRGDCRRRIDGLIEWESKRGISRCYERGWAKVEKDRDPR